MAVVCALRGHRPISCGIRNQDREFGRCQRCQRDLIRKNGAWKAIPKGYQVVWRPRTGDALADHSSGKAAVGRETTVKGVVVGEKTFSDQRFVLVRLNANDQRSYQGDVDRLGTHGAVAAQMENRAERIRFQRNAPITPRRQTISDMVGETFDWDRFDTDQRAAGEAADRLLRGMNG